MLNLSGPATASSEARTRDCSSSRFQHLLHMHQSPNTCGEGKKRRNNDPTKTSHLPRPSRATTLLSRLHRVLQKPACLVTELIPVGVRGDQATQQSTEKLLGIFDRWQNLLSGVLGPQLSPRHLKAGLLSLGHAFESLLSCFGEGTVRPPLAAWASLIRQHWMTLVCRRN